MCVGVCVHVLGAVAAVRMSRQLCHTMQEPSTAVDPLYSNTFLYERKTRNTKLEESDLFLWLSTSFRSQTTQMTFLMQVEFFHH